MAKWSDSIELSCELREGVEVRRVSFDARFSHDGCRRINVGLVLKGIEMNTSRRRSSP